MRVMHFTSNKMNIEQKRALLRVARQAIKDYLLTKKKIYPQRSDFADEEFWKEKGTFVTITIDGNLRGCIGLIMPSKPLILDIYDNAINSAFRDPRFYPLKNEEFDSIKIEISILSVPKEIHFNDYKELLDKIRPGIDGIIIRKGYYQATFLPQVWEEIPNKIAFFEFLCQKAGLNKDCYKDKSLEVQSYQVENFDESLLIQP